MKLISLKLLHYRRFRQQEITFKDDFSLIFGKNGAGKSSVLDAIGYALFGPSSKDFVRVNRDYLRSYFLHDREPSKIELTFQYGFDTYKIVRIIDTGTKKFASDFIVETKDTLLGPNGVEIIGGDEITDYISELIGVNKETFLRSVFAKQKDLEVLSGGLSERKELINKVLGLDKIEGIILSFKSEEKEKKTLLEIYKKKVSEFDLETLKTKKEELNLSLKTVIKNLESEQNLLKILNETFSKTKIDFELQDKKRQTFQEFGNQVNSISKLNENLKNQNENITLEIQKIILKETYLKQNLVILETEKKLSDSLEKQNQNKIFFEENKKLKISLENCNKELETLNKFLSDFAGIDLVKQIENLEQDLKNLDQDKQEKIKHKIELDNKINYLRKEYEELKKELDNIKKLDYKADCPTCKRPLEEYFPNLLKLYEEKLNQKATQGKNLKDGELQKIDELLQKIEKEIFLKNSQVEILKNKEKEFIKYSQNKINLEKNIDDITIKLKEIGDVKFDEKEFDKLKISYEEVKKSYLEYLKIQGEVRSKPKLEEDFTNNKIQFEKNLKELENFTEKIKSLQFNEESYQKIKEIYFTINTQINEKNDQIQSINKEKLTQEFDLKNLEKLEDDFKEDKKNIDLYVLELAGLALKKQIMSDYIIYLLNHLKPHIEDLASDYFSIITDYKYTSISLDDDYNIMVDGKNLDLYSGGERDLANLCLRLSLGQNLTSSKGNPINFLILDEVLASQDKDRQQNILINLKKLENKFSQIILISHLEEIKDLATNLIEIKAINRDESIVNYY